MTRPSLFVLPLLLAVGPVWAGEKPVVGGKPKVDPMITPGPGGGGGANPTNVGGAGGQVDAKIMRMMQNANVSEQYIQAFRIGKPIDMPAEELLKVARSEFQEAAGRAPTELEKTLINNASGLFEQRIKEQQNHYARKDLLSLDQTVTKTADAGSRIITVLATPGLSAAERYQKYVELSHELRQSFGGGQGGDRQEKGEDGRGDGDRFKNKDAQNGKVEDAGQRFGGSIEGIARSAVIKSMYDLADTKGVKVPPPAPEDSGALPPAPTPGDILGGVPHSGHPADSDLAARDKLLKGDPNGALGDLSQSIANGGGARSLTMRGNIYLDQKDYGKALADGQAALEADPRSKEARALVAFSAGRAPSTAAPAGGERGFGGAASGGAAGAASFASAARGAPAASVLTAGASRASSAQAQKAAENALSLRDNGGALGFVNKALESDANNPSLLNLRAAIYARMKDYKHASEDAKAGLALAPRNGALLRTKGYSDLRGGNYKDALGSANQLLELDPKDAYAFALRAHAYGDMGDRDAMMADLRRAAELDPRYQQAAASALQMPSDSDILFLFPGEENAKPASAASAAAPQGRNRKFGALVGLSAFGGLLLALGLLQTVLAPLKDKVSSVFTRVTRTGPSVASFASNDTAQPASVNGLMPGLIRGQYEISRQIGQGGMGMVYEGTDRALGRRVAIKKMREELRINPQERARFVIEAKTVAALHHPSIVDIYAIAEDGQDVFLVFEYVDGKTVHDLVQLNGRLPLKQAANVVRAAADALTYAHSKGVIHRDMKPSNMMINGAGTVKVMDFGIARMAKDAMTRYSMTNTIVGTPPYMAPEQEQGQVRRESDVYALAVCAYEMLTGKLPFIGIGAGMLMNKINMSYVAPSHAIAGLPEALDPVFTKAFQALPENRYRTPQEFADALETALGSGVRA